MSGTAADDLACRDLVEVITDYFDGAMNDDDRTRFERHLAGCSGCQAVLSQFRTTLQITRRLTEDQVPGAARRDARRVQALARNPERLLVARGS
jgi:anti-sigma factor RsiW